MRAPSSSDHSVDHWVERSLSVWPLFVNAEVVDARWSVDPSACWGSKLVGPIVGPMPAVALPC